MKRLLLFSLITGFGLSAIAQSNSSNFIKKQNISNEAYPYMKQYQGNEPDNNPIRNQNKYPYANSKSHANEYIIGTTTYDLQSNASMQHRVANHGDGTISATWTYSQTGDLAASDRGTGYNYFDGSSWGASPTNRAEPGGTRTGWSSVNGVGAGEVVISHDGNGDLHMIKTTTKGSGSWTASSVASGLTGHDMLWPRSTIGGAAGNTIHAIAITAPVANQGTIYKGIDGALLYYRSQDGGLTWDIQDSLLPGIDSTLFSGFSGDSYVIHAEGNTVAFAVFNDFQDNFIMKSTDNGDTWTKQNIIDSPLDDYDAAASGAISDVDNNGVADTVQSADGAGAIIVDGGGNVHVWYGNMRYLDDDPAAGANFSFFPATSGVMYWNETMGTTGGTNIAGLEDRDNSGAIEGVSFTSSGSIPLYFVSLTGFPTAGISANGGLFLVYSAHMEDLDQTSQNYRHLYATYSYDGGTTWKTPVHLQEDISHDYHECVFPSLANNVDSRLRLTYQRDGEPGLAARGDGTTTSQDPGYGDSFTTNDIVYMTVDTAIGKVGVKEKPKAVSNISIYPNPANDNVKINFKLNENNPVEVKLINLVGSRVATISNEGTAKGVHNLDIDVSDLPSGVYFVNITSGNKSFTEKLIVN